MTTIKSIKTIHDLLAQYRDLIKNKRDLGTSFEQLMKNYFQIEPAYAALFKSVWLWSEWPLKWGPDCGIDLVAEDFEGKFYAVQCKFFGENHELKKEDIDSFFNESGKKFGPKKNQSFFHRFVVSTTNRWSQPAERSLDGQTIEVTRISLEQLEQSSIDWSKFSFEKKVDLKLKKKKDLWLHQKEALTKVSEGFKKNDRGRLIMACGTGKTFTALKIAEAITQCKGNILFLVPSISLLSQTLREWTTEASEPFHAFAVCSDTKVGRDKEDISKHDLSIPATTDSKSLISGIEKSKKEKRMTVVFSTYQSIDVIGKAHKLGLPQFDLIICDEAHRTTGVTFADKDESHFVRIHDADLIKGKKRLYMTATPRIYGDAAKTKASKIGADITSMDNSEIYGPEFHRLGFGDAVNQGLLSDYKVLVLAVDENHVSKTIQQSLARDKQEIEFDDLVKIVGCWNGLAKKFIGDELKADDPSPMKRAVAFARSIKDSKNVTQLFREVTAKYAAELEIELGEPLKLESEHVDGTFNVLDRDARLKWLKAEPSENTCRILSNARCLSEGVDVPALDAVLFLNPRDSIVDVVQSVGRIMRLAPGKKYGYVILPIGIPAGVPPEKALEDNEKYEVVWKVLQALRAHDDRLNAVVNQIDLNKSKPKQIQIIGVGGGDGQGSDQTNPEQLSFNFPALEEWRDAIYAKIVVKCGDRRYWEEWAEDVAKIAQKHIQRIESVLHEKNSNPRKTFDKFLIGIQQNINPSISESEAIEMLAQHLITRPVFDALFDKYSFTKNNPVSVALEKVLSVLEKHTDSDDVGKLKLFYDSVRKRVKGIDNPEGKQKVIVELYEKFFKLAFKKMSERLGIVYTPVEIVDFILNSVDLALQESFNKKLTNKDVHILDPFTGTGTFLVRLLQSDLIKAEDLERKYKNELHANEIVLLAYYIAAINIEETYHGRTSTEYTPFNGVILTDTFQLAEKEAQGAFDVVLPENSKRVNHQKNLSVSVLVGNPPYSVGQKDANDNNQNIDYPQLDEKIRKSYGSLSKATLQRNLFDSYIRAIRWSTDRIADQGVIGVVTNGSFLEAKNMDGLRKSLPKEYSKIYCFNLRGDQRTTGEESKKEGGKIFGSGSRTPVAITILIKDKQKSDSCEILYHDIGNYLSREEKLVKIKEYVSIKNIKWEKITPNVDGDWIEQRSPEFKNFIAIGSKKNEEIGTIFDFYSLGVVTNRDAWVYSFSHSNLVANMKKLILFYNSEMQRYKALVKDLPKKNWPEVSDVVDSDEKKISWTRGLKAEVQRFNAHVFDKSKIVVAAYRPFAKSFLYFDRKLNETVSLVPSIFPDSQYKNTVISVIGQVDRKGFSVLVTDMIPDLCLLDTGQYFPMYYYEKADDNENLFANESNSVDQNGFIRKDSISDYSLLKFRKTFANDEISKEDIFFYVYGVLHSTTYRNRYQNDLKKMLPRIPFLKDFWGYSKKGRALAELHLNFESAKPFEVIEEIKVGSPKSKSELYKVHQIKFSKTNKELDKTKIIYNNYITISGIPPEAYTYILNGKSAVESVMERFAFSVDLNSKGEGSGIQNDPNEWSENPRYIIDLLRKIITVSIETNKLVSELPSFEILKE